MQQDIDVMKVARQYLDKAQKLLARDGYLAPVAFMVLPDGSKDIISLGEFQGQADKERKFQFLHRKALEANADVLIEIADAYYRDFRDNPQELMARLEHGGPSLQHDPQATEAIMMMVAVREGGAEMVTVPYQRHPNGAIVFSSPKFATQEYGDAHLEQLGLVVPPWATSRHKGSPFRGRA